MRRVRSVSFAAVLIAWSACLPSRDLRDYGAAWAEPGIDASLVPAPAAGAGGTSSEPPSDGAGAGGVPTSEGEGRAQGELPLSPFDAGTPTLADAAPASPCAAGELLGANGHCYFLEPRPLGFADARAACQARGTGWDLTSVRSAADSEFLGAVLPFEAWLGASDAASEGTWVWIVDGQPFWSGTPTTGAPIGGAYVNWNATEPNGAATTNCARALPRSFGSQNPNAPWADLACGELIGAICEQYPAP